MNRQDKIKYIVEWRKNTNSSINLRVCWEGIGGVNDCRCEKCCRTITSLLIEEEDPTSFGFDNVSTDYIIEQFNKKKWIFNEPKKDIWNDMKKNIKEVDYGKFSNYITFLRNFDIDHYSKKTYGKKKRIDLLKKPYRFIKYRNLGKLKKN